jgi:hypothetical protein
MMRRRLIVVISLVLFGLAVNANAAMGGGNAPAMMGGSGMPGMPPGGPAMTNNGAFGMMSGMAGSPVVGNDGTAYLVTHTPSSTPGQTPTSDSFESGLFAVRLTGEVVSLTLRGIVSRPVVFGNTLVATASLPDFGNYTVEANYRSVQGSKGSVVYLVPLPLSQSSQPIAATLDGDYASVPVLTDTHAYVTTTDFGNAMMQGDNMFNGMFGMVNFNNSGSAKSYLYIFNLDGTLVSKTEIH